MTKPITPDEIVGLKKKLIPPQVFDAFNEMIAMEWNGRYASFSLAEVVDRVKSKIPQEDWGKIFTEKWMDVETVYRKEGWKVKYESGDYDSSIGTFWFEKKKEEA